jgi:hypothetical protein
VMRSVAYGFAAFALLVAVLGTASANAAPDVAHFSVTPSTTQAGSHPNLQVSIAFAAPTSDVRDFALHLPTGLTANPAAIPFCPRKRLLAGLCSSRTKVGLITLVAEAFGFELPVTRKIYNVRPVGTERLRLGVPIYGTFSRPGVAAELPVTERPADKGLALTLTGLPQEVNGYRIRIKRLDIWIRGTARTRIRKRLRTRAFLTNPRTCTPATSVLELTSHDVPPVTIRRESTFTPTGC